MPEHNGFLDITPPARTSLSDSDVVVNAARHRAITRHLRRFRFWEGDGKVRGLWEHQQQAISVAVAYLITDHLLPHEGGHREAALLKLPTGSGKSGIIAILARCIPDVRKVLLLTPRTALTEQLLADVQFRFWGNIGLHPEKTTGWSLPAAQAGTFLEPVHALHLLPRTAASITEGLEKHGTARTVLVATLQAFAEISRGADELDHADRTKGEIPADRESTVKLYGALREQLRTFDLVVVDEGHYEPAPSWSRAVRGLDRPTILLSATPFRNDYKSFRVRGRFVYNLPVEDATDEHIIREVVIPTFSDPRPVKPRAAPRTERRKKSDDEDTQAPRVLSPEDLGAISAFVRLLERELPDVLKAAKAFTEMPKVILRADGLEALINLQEQVRHAFKDRPVLIHDRVKRNNPAARQFHTVKAALSDSRDALFWLHESKLLEGIDDANFVAVGILDGFTNTRQLVQQVGRVIRSTDPKRKQRQTAMVLALSDLRADITARWKRYEAFEKLCRSRIKLVIQSEAALPERVLEQMPDYQYVAGDFRQKFLMTGEAQAVDLQLPLRTSVFVTDPDFDSEEAERELEEAILAEDRFLPRPITGLPAGMFGRTYYAWRTTPYLSSQYLAEWALGICVAAQIGRYLFVQDTGGIAFELPKLRIKRANRATLLKTFPESTRERTVTIARMASQSLDMTDRGIRSQAVRMRDLAAAFSDLLDPSLVNSSVYGYVGGKGRYLGLSRAKIADVADQYVGIDNYHAWLQRLQVELEGMHRPNAVFERYAQLVELDDEKAAPVSILMDLTWETLHEFQVVGEADPAGGADQDLPYEDVCAEVGDNGSFQIVALDGTKVPCTIEYVPGRGRYHIASPELDARHPPKTLAGSRRPAMLCEQINREQGFRVLTKADGVVYCQGSFYKTRDLVTPSGLVPALEDAVAVPALSDTISEKGETFFTDKPRWRTKSVFGVIHTLVSGAAPSPALQPLAEALGSFDIVLLDDGGDEIGDFVALDRTGRRVALIHAKASKKSHTDAVTHLQAVGRQVLGSLGFCSTQARVDGLKANRWDRAVIANKVKLPISRYFRMPVGMTKAQASEAARSALASPVWGKEVWIVAGRLLDVEAVRNAAITRTPTNRRRQLLMFLESLRTCSQRANARLRIFAH